jgi:hypothetical protein
MKILMGPVAVSFEYDEIERAAEFWKTDMQDALARLMAGKTPGNRPGRANGPTMLEGDGLLGGAVLGDAHPGSTTKH